MRDPQKRDSRFGGNDVRDAMPMRAVLQPHPDHKSLAATSMHAEISAGPRGLRLRYVVSGNIGALRLPAPSASVRSDGLWQHSCFEAFLRRPGEDAYYELNLSPSGEWAFYRLAGYRSGMEPAPIRPPKIAAQSVAGGYELEAEVELPKPGPWRLGLSAVIEERDGRKSYWALAHPPGEPDFHHAHCFALQLPPAA
jgi:hypothetical protein